MISEFKVSGMHCASCVGLIKLNVQELKGIQRVSGDPKKGTVEVAFDGKAVTSEEIAQKIGLDGYRVTGYKDKKG